MWMFNFEFHLVLAKITAEFLLTLEHAHYRPKGIVVDGSANKICFVWRSGGSEKLESDGLARFRLR